MKSKNKERKNLVPLSMSMADRNERIYQNLLSMGLFVTPVFADSNKKLIDHFVVSTGMPNRLFYNHGQDQG